ncbi:TetR/AcrR family transcriptional regulator [Rhodococcus spelaei]|uniref:TetR/AcrR family transcriptional regulator n=1 Tax=Rhodococcus spelaei TaxID=2546320 RepID=A0A541B923_9NOCA|nr:TetR/AcrR family transcriptional regulator [Rhodococcus spelaei]TQF68807.1 TetR/AcrR family transcriptional regulator [Rhodococcus spelaei]
MTQSTRNQSVPDSVPTRKRPKDRKSQIALVAAQAFSERGYHAVGVDEIAAALGISGPALYRHFPNKYALLVQASMSTVGSLRTAAEGAVDATEDAAPDERLDAILRGLITTTVENRRTGGLYRWEGRYLQPADRDRMRGDFAELNRLITVPLRELRADLDQSDAQILAASALSVIGSITAHRAPLAGRRLEKLLLGTARGVLRCDLGAAPAAASTIEEPAAGRGLAVTSKRELLLGEAMKIFNERGYHESSIEEIGAAAGINASSVYRHFPSKADLLAAAFYRAADRLAMATATALGASTEPAEALERLSAAYIDLAFAHPEVLSVYFAEIGNLPAGERTNLRNVQRLHIEEWVHLLTGARPELAPTEARFLVHAAVGQALDVGRLMHFDTSAEARGQMQALMLTVLRS